MEAVKWIDIWLLIFSFLFSPSPSAVEDFDADVVLHILLCIQSRYYLLSRNLGMYDNVLYKLDMIQQRPYTISISLTIAEYFVQSSQYLYIDTSTSIHQYKTIPSDTLRLSPSKKPSPSKIELSPVKTEAQSSVNT